MKSKIVLLALAMCVIAAIPLAASEAVWDVIVPTDLRPSTFTLPDPLAEPAFILMETLVPESSPALSPQLAIPPRMPSFPPVVRSGKALFDANLVLMVGLNVADYFSTREALKYPGLTESNPLMKPFVKSPAAFAAVKFGTTALTYWSMKTIFKRNRTVAWVMTTASNVLLSYVVANNMRLVQGARAR
jgi:Domain of unknown function (DUF5658)